MKKTIIALALAAAIPPAVLAASDHRGHRHGGPDVARLAETLDLSAEQQDRVRALFEAHRAEREALREKMRTGMAEVLTAEQQAKLDALREERRAQRQERHGKRGHHRHHGSACGTGEDAAKS